tara:strand:+ start:343 stop:669 length:327 start_codon:yes stop_codon:yes gene_type:complete
MKNKNKFIAIILFASNVFTPLAIKALPKGEAEYFLYGGGMGVANTLCELTIYKDINLETSKEFRNNFINVFKKNLRDYQVTKKGFNDGLTAMMEGSEEYRSCSLLKIN